MPRNVLEVPKDIAVCPYCRAAISMDVDEWDAETGAPTEAGVHLWCTAVSVDDWDEVDRHTRMPYVYWLPVGVRVYQAFARYCRVDGDELIAPELAEDVKLRNAGVPTLPGLEA